MGGRTDGQGVLVVAVADLATLVFLVGPAVDEALSVVHVAVLGRAAGGRGLARVAEINKDQSTAAGGVAGSGSDNVGEARLVVGENVVCAAIGEIAVEASEVVLGVEDDGALAVVDGEKLGGQ